VLIAIANLQIDLPLLEEAAEKREWLANLSEKRPSGAKAQC
jgi:hypothetical protein